MDLIEAGDLARELIERHRLRGWTFHFDYARKRFGYCNYARKSISLSAPLVSLNSREEVLDTILHEIAHALVGPQHRHDAVWRAKAREIGCSGDRCFGGEVSLPPPRYVTECPNCGKKGRAERMRVLACGDCCRKLAAGRYDVRFKLRFHRMPVEPLPARPVRGLADAARTPINARKSDSGRPS